MNIWQFLDSLPDAVWYIALALVGATILFVFGGGMVSVIVTLCKKGKVKITKEGIEESTLPEDTEKPK